MSSTKSPIHTYNNGQPYFLARGRNASSRPILDRGRSVHSIVKGFPDATRFLKVVNRELKIRNYSRKTVKNYISHLRSFLSWFGNRPHRVTIEDVRGYLEMLVDSGANSASLAGSLCAIRTAFDKFCGRDVTLGLATPRKNKTQPVILSRTEVEQLIQAAPRRDIKLAIGLMYAAGLRNSELCRLRIRDFDFERNLIRVDQGKGRCDRIVVMPKTFFKTFQQICADKKGEEYLFAPSDFRAGRHISPRTLQRWVSVTASYTGIKKRVTPHSFRHAFATHLLESGTDIRFIQRLLGHKRLETTTIYTRLAKLGNRGFQTPLDQLAEESSQISGQGFPSKRQTDSGNQKSDRQVVGKLAIQFTQRNENQWAVVLRIKNRRPVVLSGIFVRMTSDMRLEVSFPIIECWASALRQLPAAQRERITDVSFIGRMHRIIADRVKDMFDAERAPPLKA